MATTFKTFLNDDTVTSRTLLHEAIPITGSIPWGTYPIAGAAGSNIKEYTHGMFQSVYDYPYLSSSANHIFDLTIGVSANSSLVVTNQLAKKRNIYNQMAQVLVGYDATGAIQRFDQDGDLIAGGVKYDDLIFINFARLLGKDEIKKGTFQITVDTTPAFCGGTYGACVPYAVWPYNNPAANLATDGQLIIGDQGSPGTTPAGILVEWPSAETDYRVNSPAGEYGILRVQTIWDPAGPGPYVGGADYLGLNPCWEPACGLIFYQAGVVALSKDIFRAYVSPGAPPCPDPILEANRGKNDALVDTDMGALGVFIDVALAVNDIDYLCTAFRNRIHEICFNNTTELNSTIYFCRVNHNDFNYSSNPTYLHNSKIRVKSRTTDAPISYITTVGLYSADNELLAVAKVSEPLRKDPTNDITLRVRLDY